MQNTPARSRYLRRLLIGSAIVLLPCLLAAKGNVILALALPWAFLDERSGWFQLIPDSRLYIAGADLLTVLTLVITARWQRLFMVVVGVFLLNLLFALWFDSAYDGHA